MFSVQNVAMARSGIEDNALPVMRKMHPLNTPMHHLIFKHRNISQHDVQSSFGSTPATISTKRLLPASDKPKSDRSYYFPSR